MLLKDAEKITPNEPAPVVEFILPGNGNLELGHVAYKVLGNAYIAIATANAQMMTLKDLGMMRPTELAAGFIRLAGTKQEEATAQGAMLHRWEKILAFVLREFDSEMTKGGMRTTKKNLGIPLIEA